MIRMGVSGCFFWYRPTQVVQDQRLLNGCVYVLYFYQLHFPCSLLKHVLQFQSRHNSHTGHCYVILFAAGKSLDVIITIMKIVQYSVSCPQSMQKVESEKNFPLAPLMKSYPPPTKQWCRPCKQ